jgi:nucleoside 2-deoxyribosyltransferase
MQLTMFGWEKYSELKRQGAAISQAFVAMWFDDTTEDAWTNGLQKGIADAGYEPLRINMKEHVNKICDEIIAEIRRSRFVVADYTGHRGGVYYEAGFASGLGLTVIPTCRRDEVSKLHFDVRQYYCIDWETPRELARRLQARIEAVMGSAQVDWRSHFSRAARSRMSHRGQMLEPCDRRARTAHHDPRPDWTALTWSSSEPPRAATGREDGRAAEHWLSAERELLASARRQTTAAKLADSPKVIRSNKPKVNRPRVTLSR